MREEFEIWAESRGLDLYCSRKDLYADTETLWAWSAWKASRAAIILPEALEVEVVGVGCTFQNEYLDIDEVVAAIGIAGEDSV